jgi:hypothetical protein
MATYLLVAVDDDEAGEIGAFIATVGGVESVEVHNEDPGRSCCCQNCPGRGNHG